MTSSGISLYYFPLRARAECLRMILHYGGIPFEDVIIQMDQWKDIKANGEIAPFGQLPSMRLPDGSIIAQTGAIARYCAKIANIYPHDPAAAAKADMIFEFAHELNMISPLLNFWPINTDVWKNNFELFFKALPQHLIEANRLIGEGPFFGGAKPHHGDFGLFHIFDACLMIQPQCLDDFPKLKTFMTCVAALPGVREYLQNRLPPAKVGLCGSYMQAEIAKVYHSHA